MSAQARKPVSIGLIELNSIAVGIETGDAMLKAAYVNLLRASTICPGKYIVLVYGAVDAVRASVQAGRECGAENVVDHLIIPSVHPEVIPAIAAATEVEVVNAIGVIETFSAASSIVAADFAAKAADIQLIEIRLANGIGGKSFVVMTGEIAAVQASVAAGEAHPRGQGLLLKSVVIASPHEDLKDAIL
ncbi:MAG: BMC domain-containing protein [Candidatus Coatesbacteria bacterium]|nr:BMC domain-containing protein [Candidatus Coatesbacteria bacterium]